MNRFKSIVKNILSESDRPNSNGVHYQSDFTIEEKDRIRDEVESRVAEMAEQGYGQGEIIIEWEQDGTTDTRWISGWFWLTVEYDDDDDEATDQEVARLIRQGYNSGYFPSFDWSANVWED